MDNHQLINQTSGKTEYYTPPEIIRAARATMGGIDLDPASSLIANQTVGATAFYTAAQDGVGRPWFGRVWLNHPFGRGRNRRWVGKLVGEYEGGRIEQACCITYAATAARWFQPLLAYPVCFLCPRTNYVLPDGRRKRGVTKGSAVTYLGPHVGRFRGAFAGLGTVKQ